MSLWQVPDNSKSRILTRCSSDVHVLSLEPAAARHHTRRNERMSKKVLENEMSKYIGKWIVNGRTDKYEQMRILQRIRTMSNVFAQCLATSKDERSCWTTGFVALAVYHSQEWSVSNFPCFLTRNITQYSVENLAFHSLHRWKMIILPILTPSLIHFSSKVGRMYYLWTWEWKGYARILLLPRFSDAQAYVIKGGPERPQTQGY